jgi:hypothetical protein
MPNYALGKLAGSACDTILPPPPPAPVPLAWQVYPNPTTDMLYIDVPDSSATQIELAVHNAVGQCLHTYQLQVNAKHQAEFSLQHLAKAVYFVSIRHKQERFVKKVMKL